MVLAHSSFIIPALPITNYQLLITQPLACISHSRRDPVDR
jgi:hypothetical protein